MSKFRTKILGTGVYLPEKIVTNDDLAKSIDTSDEWIYERTGIKERRICRTTGGEFPTDMALNAAKMALKTAGLTPNDLDLILFATCTPDQKLPNSATILQTKLGITNQCGCLEILAACSGFVYGLNMAGPMIEAGIVKNVLVVGSEMLSREVNWQDRTSCILFGDGCGAAVIGRATDSDKSEIFSSHLGADGTGKEYFETVPGGAVQPLTQEIMDAGDHLMKMKGKEMFKVATRTLADNAKLVLEKAGMSLDQVNWLVPHQANIRIIETTGKLLGIESEKVIVNIEKYGNTSAATIPIAFHEAVTAGKIKRGDIVLFDAFGAGLTSGATLFRY
jgi:3-oxoacyl-[acyl-carrier-protein] synthase III